MAYKEIKKQLYYVEFGKPDITSNYSSSYREVDSIFILACSFDEAANSALQIAENQREEKVEKRDIFGEHGSLRPEVLEQMKPLTIKGIKIVTERIYEV